MLKLKENFLSWFSPYYTELGRIRQAERDEIARREQRVERVVAERDRVRELNLLRPSVSAADIEHAERLESFADRLIRENVAKQSETERSAGWTRIGLSKLERIRQEQEYGVRGFGRARRESAPAATGIDPRAYSGVASTVFGTDAWFDRDTSDLRSALSMPRFANPGIVVPCLQRMVRKEVLFARGQAGKGHRVKHRRGPYTGVPC